MMCFILTLFSLLRFYPFLQVNFRNKERVEREEGFVLREGRREENVKRRGRGGVRGAEG